VALAGAGLRVLLLVLLVAPVDPSDRSARPGSAEVRVGVLFVVPGPEEVGEEIDGGIAVGGLLRHHDRERLSRRPGGGLNGPGRRGRDIGPNVDGDGVTHIRIGIPTTYIPAVRGLATTGSARRIEATAQRATASGSMTGAAPGTGRPVSAALRVPPDLGFWLTFRGGLTDRNVMCSRRWPV